MTTQEPAAGREEMYAAVERVINMDTPLPTDTVRLANRITDTILALIPDPALRMRERAAEEWRPIETAPKDGSWFLGWNGNWMGVCCFWEQRYEDDPCWVDETTSFIEPTLTHWRPLPRLHATFRPMRSGGDG